MKKTLVVSARRSSSKNFGRDFNLFGFSSRFGRLLDKKKVNIIRYCMMVPIMLLLLVSCSKPTSFSYLDQVIDYEFQLQKVDYGSLFKNRERIFDTINATPADSNGVSLFMWKDKSYYHPVNLSYKALEALSDYSHTKEERYLNHAIKTMEALRLRAHREGEGIWFVYDFTFTSSGFTYHAPWYSGMAQVTALSAYSRLYHYTSNPLFAAVADSILYTFTDFTSPKSTVMIANNDELFGEGTYYWVDEYPYAPRRFVLNGSIIGAMGLYDYWWVFDSEHARRLFSMELSSVKDQVLKYRNPSDVSAYCLRLRRKFPDYHTVHIYLLRLCHQYTNDEFFGYVADLFESDYSQ